MRVISEQREQWYDHFLLTWNELWEEAFETLGVEGCQELLDFVAEEVRRRADNHREPDWYGLYRREMTARTEEMVRNAGLVEQNSELLRRLAEMEAQVKE